MLFRSRPSALVAMGLILGLLATACEAAVTPTAEVATPTATATATAAPAIAATVTPTTVPANRDQVTIEGAPSGAIVARGFGSGSDAAFVGIEGEPFILDGASSQDDGVIKAFSWRQVSGPTALISDSNSPAPGVVPPTAGTYVFELMVMDSSGVTTNQRAEVKVEKFQVREEFGQVQQQKRWMGPEPSVVGKNVSIQFALFDSTADDVKVEVQFSTDGGTTWTVATNRFLRATDGEGAGDTNTGTADRSTEGRVPTRTVVPDVGALEREEARIATTPTAVASADAITGETGVVHRFVWDAQADLGTNAQKVVVRGWDPVKKEEIVGVAVVYDPGIDDVATECGLHADLWRADEATTTVRNLALDACAVRILDELQAASAISADQADKIGSGLRDYTDKAMERGVDGADLGQMIQQNMEFMALQNAVQQESRKFQTLSNIMKTKHDTMKAIIQNLRA